MKFHPTALACPFLTLALLVSCGPQGQPPADDHHGHDHGPDGQHLEPENHQDHAHHDGPAIALGTAPIGPFQAVATRDAGAINPGGDAAIDVTVTPAADSGRTVAAVRFWIGLEDGDGSVRARAEIENPAEPNRWHTHAEVPSPLPEGGMLWVEIEDDQGTLHAGSFPLNPAG